MNETNINTINLLALSASRPDIFIQTYVHIEDRDSSQLAVPFELWDGQIKALKDFETERLNIVLKARQLGLTWLALAYSVWNLVFNNGYQVVALSKTEDDAKELVRRVTFILRYLPDWMIIEKTKDTKDVNMLMWDNTTSEVTFYHPDKEVSIFKSMPAGQNSGRSLTANLLLLDEWAFQQWAREIWSAAYPTINRPTGGKVIGLSTAKRMTLFEEIWNKAKQKRNTFNPIFLSWRTDPRRTNDWYEQTKKDLGDHQTKQEYPSTPEEAFEAAEGLAFPEYSYDIHVIPSFDIPKHWVRWQSGDNGYNDPFAFYWFAVSEDGIIHVYREFTRDYKAPKLLYDKQAKKFVELSNGDNIGVTVLGIDAWSKHHRDTTGKAIVDYYRDGGLVNVIRAITDRALRKATIHQYLDPYYDEITAKYTAKLQIHDCCHKLIDTLPQLLVDENDAEKVAECDYDHWFDSLGYGLIYHHSKRTTKEISKYDYDYEDDDNEANEGSWYD